MKIIGVGCIFIEEDIVKNQDIDNITAGSLWDNIWRMSWPMLAIMVFNFFVGLAIRISFECARRDRTTTGKNASFSRASLKVSRTAVRNMRFS